MNITNFLSKPLNLSILYGLLYFLISYTLFNAQMNITTIVALFILIILTNFVSHLRGTANGVMFATVNERQLKKMMKYVDEIDNGDDEQESGE